MAGGCVTRSGRVIVASLLAVPIAMAAQVAAGQGAVTQGGRAETAVLAGPSSRVASVQPRISSQPVARASRSPCPEVAALPAEAARALVARVATEEGFFPDFVTSVAKVESRYVSTALSDKGAYGLMQLMPDTARRYEVDLCDPEGNVRGGIRLLRVLHARYRNPLFILAAYNAGEDVVRKTRGVPPFPETVRFVADVLNDFYAWPDTAGGAKPPAMVAAAATPGIVELDGAVPPTPPVAAPNLPNIKAAAPRWDGGFVMHVE